MAWEAVAAQLTVRAGVWVYNTFFKKRKRQEPLVPRDLRFDAVERTSADGTVVTPVDLAPVIESALAMLYDGQLPAPHLWVLALRYATASLCLGLAVFTRYEDRFAESV